MMSTPLLKGSNAMSFYDHEGYDEAFLKASYKEEEKYSLPMHSLLYLLSPAECLQGPMNDISYNRHSKVEVKICRDDLTPKKLDFNAAPTQPFGSPLLKHGSP